MMNDWLEDMKQAGVLGVAARLGLRHKRQRLEPCPVCNAERSGADKRPTVGVRRDNRGWKCHSCGVTGDAVDLASLALIGCKAGKAGAEFRKIRSWWLEDGPELAWEPAQYEVTRPPAKELERVLRACERPSESSLPALPGFLAKRGFDPNAVAAGILPPRDWAGWIGIDWWPAPWVDQFPLVIPAFTGTGQLVSMHGRSIDDSAKRKTTWPKGHNSAGLLFADSRYARRMLRNQTTDAETLLVVEGLTDYLWAVQTAPARCGVIGIASGSATSLKLPRWPENLRFYVGSDPDPTGDAYAVKVAEALAPHTCRRLPLHIL